MQTVRLRKLFLALWCLSFLAGCGGGSKNQANLPPVDDTRGGAVTLPASTPRAPMITKKRVVMLAGAAALYYLYKKHQNSAAATGPEGQYYLSKNGRVYYRDAQHRAHWVTPPAGGISVPAEEAGEYQQYQGYNGSSQGRDLTGIGRD